MSRAPEGRMAEWFKTIRTVMGWGGVGGRNGVLGKKKPNDKERESVIKSNIMRGKGQDSCREKDEKIILQLQKEN